MEALTSHLSDVRALAQLARPTWKHFHAVAYDESVALNDGEGTTAETAPPRFRTVEEFEARQVAIREALTDLDQEYAGRIMPDAQRSRWNQLNEELEENTAVIVELRARTERLQQVSQQPSALERSNFETQRTARGPADIYDVWAIRQQARGPQDEARMLRDAAMRSVETSHFAHPEVDQDAARSHIEGLMARFTALDDDTDPGLVGGESNLHNFCRQILLTGSPVYRRAFGKAVMHRPLSPEEQRALSTTGSGGGFAVPYTLDPTIIPTSNSSVNPYRAIARVETIATTTWQGVTSPAITATRRAQGSQTADGAPTLAQPTVTPQRVDAFVPYSIEVGQDWGSLEAEMARLIQDAKDDEEATSYTSGNGVAPAAQGILSGATVVVTGAGTATFAVGDVYTLYNSVPPRFKPRAQWVANEAIYNLIRQFDTQGGASLWIDNLQLPTGGFGVPTPGNLNARLLGRPANECSAYASAVASSALVATLGDWRYFIIVDRIGMTVELIPHLFGTSQLPTGSRGLFAYWRNDSRVISSAAFRTLIVK